MHSSQYTTSTCAFYAVCRVQLEPSLFSALLLDLQGAHGPQNRNFGCCSHRHGLCLCAPCVIHASPNTLPASSASVEDASVWAARAAEAAAAFHTAFVFPGGRDVLAATANSSTQAQYWNAAMVLNVLVDSGAYPGDIGRFYDL